MIIALKIYGFAAGHFQCSVIPLWPNVYFI